jgi:hypothetical protein
VLSDHQPAVSAPLYTGVTGKVNGRCALSFRKAKFGSQNNSPSISFGCNKLADSKIHFAGARANMTPDKSTAVEIS